jgi:hypothetical protein
VKISMAGVSLLGEDQPLQETRLRVARFCGEHLVDALERLLRLAALEQPGGILEIVRAGREGNQECRGEKRNEPPPGRRPL